MKFENRGKWLKEAEGVGTLVFDEREPADYLDGDNKVITMEDNDELLDEVEGEDFEEINKAEPADQHDEPIQKNEAFGPDDIVSVAKQMEFKKQYLQGKDKRKVNPNSFYFDNVYAVDDNTGDNIPGAKLGMKYKDLAAALDKFFMESSQKNEGPNEFDKNKYKEDFFEYKNGVHGDFMEYLAKACMQADKNNLAKLEKVFPELLRVFCLWKSSGKTDKVNKL